MSSRFIACLYLSPMSTAKAAIERYVQGDYQAKHPNWHLADSAKKAADLQAALEAMLRDSPQKKWSIVDVGAGAGGVLDETIKRINAMDRGIEVQACGFEISPHAIALAAQRFPHLSMRQKFFEASDGPFDAVMFTDVLEHSENPWEMLRTAREAARYMLVRQPLLENFSTFRHDNYRNQREEWGHVGFFTYRFFLEMAAATGWTPLKVDLVAPWELATKDAKGGMIQRLMTKTNRAMASYFISGFYLNGVFRRAVCKT